MKRIDELLEQIYGRACPSLSARITALADAAAERITASASTESMNNGTSKWDHRDVVLITYGDLVQRSGQPHLQSLAEWMDHQAWQDLFSIIHFLPFFPYTSDDGFAVVDYRQIDPPLGVWQDVARFTAKFDLMFDLVLNHASASHEMFGKFLDNAPGYEHYFIELDPQTDLKQVVRPRSTPLLTPFKSSQGIKHVWTTFGPDQVDWNVACEDVLYELLTVFVEFIERGARIVRLDAIAYLWKELGTPCIHLPQTHAVVKLLREVGEAIWQRSIILTETNVPHAENVSYFGMGDEAHMVYQFSLPPLLLDALHHQDVSPLRDWLSTLESAPPGCTFFNFTASHDGIGVRPLEGLVDEARVVNLVKKIEQRGGRINTRKNANGEDVPYELNITYVDATAPDDENEQMHLKRFMLTQIIALSLQGVPAVYFHSLVGSRNDLAAVAESGQNRRINRHKFTLSELCQQVGLDHATDRPAAAEMSAQIYATYKRVLRIRRQTAALHPDAKQRVHHHEDSGVLLIERVWEGNRLLVAANFTETEKEIELSESNFGGAVVDLLQEADGQDECRRLGPFACRWLLMKD